jgi:hypothetical protein
MAKFSAQSSAEVKNGGAAPPLPHIFSWHSVKFKYGDDFVFTLRGVKPPEDRTILIVSVHAEIRSRYLANTHQQRYRLSQLDRYPSCRYSRQNW